MKCFEVNFRGVWSDELHEVGVCQGNGMMMLLIMYVKGGRTRRRLGVGQTRRRGFAIWRDE